MHISLSRWIRCRRTAAHAGAVLPSICTRLAPLTGASLRALAAQDAPRPDPRAAAKKAQVEALWAQLNGGGGAACRAGTPGAAGAPASEPVLAEPAPTPPAGRPSAAGGLNLAALCRPLAKQRASEDKDRARGPLNSRNDGLLEQKYSATVVRGLLLSGRWARGLLGWDTGRRGRA